MPRYTYSGPVMMFGRCIADKWEGVTEAPTGAKARSNLMYRFKKEAGLNVGARISFPALLGLVTKEDNMDCSWWIFEVTNMMGINEGFYVSFAESSTKAREKIIANLEYPAKSIAFIGPAKKYDELPAIYTLV